ncbi:hypothetical protein PVAND_005599 [Polypedilum vanderplanki]|uniref:BHLH domain-containing protein n=1 Tax=Polypedilum vanderplanki TaxID=319348 RepID=A0A9J6C2J1_POLVA|nr:hypothetical protein PVAND_005599 [Polypedilum vanderplanki]
MSSFDSDNDFLHEDYYETNGNYYSNGIYQGNQEDYEYMRKFSSTDESINQSSPTSSYHYPVYSQLDKNDYIIDDYYSSNRTNIATSTVNYNNNNNVITNKNVMDIVTSNVEPSSVHVPVVRVVRKRTTANKKERRRTQSINSAYSSLREHIPNVPIDTKLSKIKTLRLATSYISYLINVLEGEDGTINTCNFKSGFRAELVPSSRKINAERRALMKKEIQNQIEQQQKQQQNQNQHGEDKKRTGWPQSVWGNVTLGRKNLK